MKTFDKIVKDDASSMLKFDGILLKGQSRQGRSQGAGSSALDDAKVDVKMKMSGASIENRVADARRFYHRRFPKNVILESPSH